MNRRPHRMAISAAEGRRLGSLSHAFWEHRWYLMTGEIWTRPDLKPLAYPRE